jgi:hypothetical protein
LIPPTPRQRDNDAAVNPTIHNVFGARGIGRFAANENVSLVLAIAEPRRPIDIAPQPGQAASADISALGLFLESFVLEHARRCQARGVLLHLV